MTRPELLRRRMGSQLLLGGRRDPVEVVRWFGAMQAQDLEPSLTAVALRAGLPSAAPVDQAFADGRLVRTWPMRGTLHVMAVEDARWWTAATAGRALATAAGRYRALGLSEPDFERGRVVAESLLAGRTVARTELIAAFADAGLDPSGQRGIHVIGWLAMHGVIYVGARIGRQPGYGLLADLDAGSVAPADPAAEIARRYVRSHGPVTAHDLAWWTGLTVTVARAALDRLGEGFACTEYDGRPHWFADVPAPRRLPAGPLLLPRFDEYVLGYRDRTAALDAEHFLRVVPGGNGMFMQTVIERGRVTAVWRGAGDRLEVDAFGPPPPDLTAALEAFDQLTGRGSGERPRTQPAAAPVPARER